MALVTTHYKYYWDIQFFIKGIDKKIYPYKLESVDVINDYYNFFTPDMTMNIRIYEKDLMYFRKYNNQITCHITIKQMSGVDGENYDTVKVVDDDDFLPIYDKKRIPEMMNTTKIVDLNIEKDEETYETSLGENNTYVIPIKLFRLNDRRIKKYIHNYILDKANVSDAISLIIDKNEYIKNAIVDVPENIILYEDMIIPPGDIQHVLKYLQLNYGIYSRGLIVYLDKNILYILQKVSHEHSFQPDEKQLIDVHIMEDISSPNAKDYVLTDDKTVRYERASRLNVTDNESIIGELIGDKYIYSNFDSIINSAFAPSDDTMEFISPINEIDRNVTTHLETGQKIISDYDMLNNVFNLNSYMNETGVGTPVSFILQAACVEHFSPNKNIRLTLDSSGRNVLYNGIYSISNLSVIYKNTTKVNENFYMYAHCAVQLNYKYTP